MEWETSNSSCSDWLHYTHDIFLANRENPLTHKITAFEVIVRPSLSLNLVTDEENVTKSVTKLSDTLNDIIDFCSTPRSMAEIMEHLGLKHRYNVKHRYIDPLIEGGFLVMTIPEKPNSRSQKYKRALT